jgi:hypothetical protein
MRNGSESGEPPDEPPAPIKPRRPKRGAFPTPKREVEAATPYVPDDGNGDDQPDTKPDPPADVEGENDG